MQVLHLTVMEKINQRHKARKITLLPTSIAYIEPAKNNKNGKSQSYSTLITLTNGQILKVKEDLNIILARVLTI